MNSILCWNVRPAWDWRDRLSSEDMVLPFVPSKPSIFKFPGAVAFDWILSNNDKGGNQECKLTSFMDMQLIKFIFKKNNKDSERKKKSSN